jgi:hypothetical protein
MHSTQAEDETSSANYGSSNLGTPQGTNMDGPPMDSAHQQQQGGLASVPSLSTRTEPDHMDEEANKKDTAAADDLRELAAKGVCAPLWRTNQPVQPVRHTPATLRVLTHQCHNDIPIRGIGKAFCKLPCALLSAASHACHVQS